MKIIEIFLNNNITSIGIGGLFDFNATLSIIAMEFVILTFFLNFIFYDPLNRMLYVRIINDYEQTSTYRNFTLEAYRLKQEVERSFQHADNKSRLLVLKAAQQTFTHTSRKFDARLKDTEMYIQRLTRYVQTKNRKLISIEDATLRSMFATKIEILRFYFFFTLQLNELKFISSGENTDEFLRSKLREWHTGYIMMRYIQEKHKRVLQGTGNAQEGASRLEKA